MMSGTKKTTDNETTPTEETNQSSTSSSACNNNLNMVDDTTTSGPVIVTFDLQDKKTNGGGNDDASVVVDVELGALDPCDDDEDEGDKEESVSKASSSNPEELTELPRRWSDFSSIDSFALNLSGSSYTSGGSRRASGTRRGGRRPRGKKKKKLGGSSRKSSTDDYDDDDDYYGNNQHLLGPRTRMIRNVLALVYVLFTIIISVLFYLLGDAAAAMCDGTSIFNNTNFPPVVMSLLVALGFSMIGGVAYAYEILLQKELITIHEAANQSRAIVASLFPKQFRDQMFLEAEKKAKKQNKKNGGGKNNNHHHYNHFGAFGGPGSSSFEAASEFLQKAKQANEHNHHQHHLFGADGDADRPSIKKQLSFMRSNTQPDIDTKSKSAFTPLPKVRLKSFLDHEGDAMGSGHFTQHSRPIADLFPHATVLFADISGFTAWSSEREPVQVFYLLESLYKTFDRIARRFGVFKVETIGDCYMCVTGLPDPQKDHATRMVRFARQILMQMQTIVKRLERSLGPDTGDLRLRVGMNSGPVTAGVLRGEKSRFQLFGDTVNTASRMESTGERNRIQLSQTTADLVVEAGKENWILPRPDLVEAKGKGAMQTYWAIHHSSRDARTANSVTGVSSVSRASTSDDQSTKDLIDKAGWDQDDENFVLQLPTMSRSAKNARLVDWNVELLVGQLKRVVAQRNPEQDTKYVNNPRDVLQRSADTPYEEVVEAFQIPKYEDQVYRDASEIELDPKAIDQLRQVVTILADKYRDNAFHNFEHASHVTMSVHKLLNRVVTPDEIDYQRDSVDDIANDVHNYTYGITSDALSQFAIVFSALIHDVDHTGVSNPRLAEENPELGEKYKNRSVAEQNSVDIAWDILLQDQYKELQQCIFTTPDELHRFRKVLVNSVMATDIFEKDGKAFRNQRWEKAFREKEAAEESAVFEEENINLKATIVIEHIIQASDVSHTMQHWSIYQKWNERLFREMYMAFDSGRSATDPSQGWYKGELWFFDNYVIPLAKKLEECEVFGVSSDEYLNYAETNRKIWAQKGVEVVAEMVDRYKKRKELEIGGLTTDEINGFSNKDLEYIMKKLIEKGRNSGTKKADAAKGQNDAAQAWMDALEIYQRAPAASEIKDRSIIFPVYSGIHPWLKGGKIFNDANGYFEQNLARKFVRESKLYRKDPVHHYRALCMLSEVTAKVENYEVAIKISEMVMRMYNTEKHSLKFEKIYGVDRAATQCANTALYHHHLGNHVKATEVIEYVLNEILPKMDPTNTLGNYELTLPILGVLHARGEDQRCYKLFKEEVDDKFLKHHGPDAFTPTKSVHKQMLWLFGMAADPDGFDEFDAAVEYFAEKDNGFPFPFLDNIIIRTTWGVTQMYGELCVILARRLERENADLELRKKIVDKGLRNLRLADHKIRDMDGKILLPIAHKIHEPVFDEVVKMAKTLGIYTEVEREEPSPGVKVKLPQSYLVKPEDAENFLKQVCGTR